MQIENLIANGDTDAEMLVAASTTENAEWQILNREIGVAIIGGRDPAFKLGLWVSLSCTVIVGSLIYEFFWEF